MKRTRRAMRAAGSLALIVGVLLVVIYLPEMSYSSRTLSHLHDFAHVPLFILIAVLLATIWPGGLFREGRPRLLPMLRLWLVALLAGILVELMQARQGRFPEMVDVLSDGAGALIGLLLLSAHSGGRWRGAIAAALLLGAGFASPVAISAWDELQARRAFPVIADMEGRLQTARFGGADARRERVANPDGAGGHMLAVHFLPALFPRFSLRDLPQDWSRYSTFTFTVVNPGSQPFEMRVRVDDIHHDNRPQDRYTLRLTVQPGRHRIQVPLEVVAGAPDTRPMDMTAIAQVIFYGYKITEERVLLFDDFRLEPPPG